MPIFTDSFWKMRRSRRAASRFTISRNVCDTVPKSARRSGHDGKRDAHDRHQDAAAGATQVAYGVGAAVSRVGLSYSLPPAALADSAGLQRAHTESERRHQPAAHHRQLRAADPQPRLSPCRDDDPARRLFHRALHLTARLSAGHGDRVRSAARQSRHHDPGGGAAGSERDRAQLRLAASARQQQHWRPQLDSKGVGRRTGASPGALYRMGDRDRLGACFSAVDGAAALGLAGPHQSLAERGGARARRPGLAGLLTHYPTAQRARPDRGPYHRLFADRGFLRHARDGRRQPGPDARRPARAADQHRVRLVHGRGHRGGDGRYRAVRHRRRRLVRRWSGDAALSPGRQVMAGRLSGGGGFIIYTVAAATLVFVAAPLIVVVALSFSEANLAIFPPVGFTMSWYENVIANEEFRHAFVVSVTLALAATATSFALGVPAAYGLDRWPIPGARAIETMLLAPLILPILITGLALLQFMAAMRMRDAAVNLFVGHVLVTLPYLVRTVTASLKQVDRSLEEAALTLGASPWKVFWRGTVPQIGPGIRAGGPVAFQISFDDFPISLWLAGPGAGPVSAFF